MLASWLLGVLGQRLVQLLVVRLLLLVFAAAVLQLLAVVVPRVGQSLVRPRLLA